MSGIWPTSNRIDKWYIQGVTSNKHLSEFNVLIRMVWVLVWYRERGGAVEAYWAHNPGVGGSKPLPATSFYIQSN